MTRNDASRPWAWTLLMLVLLLAWDATGFDLALAQLAGGSTGFALRNDPLLVQLMHEGARIASWALLLLLFIGIGWPVWFLRRLDMRARAQLAMTVLASIVAVSSIKMHSATSCPWDLNVFGGAARYVSHWSWGVDDGGPGRCFPAGHASAAFAYVGGYFIWRRSSPLMARRWLAAAVVGGLVLGLGQQLRGAHYLSHTLWTGFICWTTGCTIDFALRCLRQLRKPRVRLATQGSSQPKMNEG